MAKIRGSLQRAIRGTLTQSEAANRLLPREYGSRNEQTSPPSPKRRRVGAGAICQPLETVVRSEN
jgi:hypothetical protein